MVSKSIGVLGSNGFIGSNLLTDLGGTGITKENYQGGKYEVLINANGNSKKNLPDIDPLTDFDLTVRNTLKSIIDFQYDVYVYISSCEVRNTSKYGLSKFLAECLVQEYCDKWLIVRLNGPIGNNMRKGPIYDILHGDKLWVSAESQFQLIHTEFISRFIKFLIENNIVNQVFDLTGKRTVSLHQAMSVLNRYVPSPEEPIIIHDIDISKADSIMTIPSSLEMITKLAK